MTTTRHAPPAPRAVPPQRLSWLTEEVGAWQRDGLVDAATAEEILGRYAASRRFSLVRLLLGLGAGFVGVGLVWLVAANLDELAPWTRLALVSAIWLGVLVAGELVARRGHDLLAGAVRLLAALGSGAVVLQAAQSLQVPAYEPRLVGLWGAVALVLAYVTRDRAPLVVGIVGSVAWLVWAGLWDEPTFLRAVVLLLAAGVAAVSAGALHESSLPRFAGPWRVAGTVLVLAGLFAAALPGTGGADLGERPWPVLVLAVSAAGLAAAGLLRGTAYARWEVAGSLATLGTGVLLAWWEPGSDPDRLTGADVAHAAVCVVAYLVVAVAVAALGTLRDSWVTTAVAAVALVVFTTFQGFAVFARIVEGAWLFVLVGLVFLATGVLFDRARRALARELTDTTGTTTREEHRP